MPLDVGNDRFEHPGQAVFQAGAEDGVDDEGALRNLREMQFPALFVVDLDNRHAKASENVEVRPGVAAHVRQCPNHEYDSVDTALQERPRHHEAIAAVIAPSAQDGDAAFESALVGGFHRGHHLTAGIFHQDQRRDSDLVDREAVGFAHLRGVEDSHQAGYAQAFSYDGYCQCQRTYHEPA